MWHRRRGGEFRGLNERAGFRLRQESAAGTGHRALGREGFLPAPGSQLPDILVRMTGQPSQDVVEVGIRFYLQSFAGDHQREEIGRLLSARLLADVQPIASSQDHVAQAVLGRVVVQLGLSDFQVSSHRGPLVLRIAQRLTQRLNDQMDALVPQFAAANAKFVEDYNNARIIVDSGGGKAKAKPPTPPTPPPA